MYKLNSSPFSYYVALWNVLFVSVSSQKNPYFQSEIGVGFIIYLGLLSSNRVEPESVW